MNKNGGQRQNMNSLEPNKHKCNFNIWFVLISILGFVILLSANFYQELVFEKIENHIRQNSTRYRRFLSIHTELLSEQNANYLIAHNKKLGPIEGNGGELIERSPEFYDLLNIVQVYNYIDTCKSILGDAEFQRVLNATDAIPLIDDIMPAYSLPVSEFSLQCYYSMDNNFTELRNNRESARKLFLIAYVVGSFLIGMGGIRRKQGKFSKSFFWKWGGAALLLLAWITQNFLDAKWEARQDDIKEVNHQTASLIVIEIIYHQTSLLLPLQAMKRIGGIDTLKQGSFALKCSDVDKRIQRILEMHKYTFLHLLHLNQLLFNTISVKEQVNFSHNYKTLRELLIEALTPVSRTEYIVLRCVIFHHLMKCKLDDEVKQLNRYQSKAKYILIILLSVGTIFLIFAQFRTIRR